MSSIVITTAAPPAGSLALVSLELAAAGYRPGIPSHVRPQAAAIDQGTLREAECASCGTVGLSYHPFAPARGHGYCVVAVCPVCGHAAEL